MFQPLLRLNLLHKRQPSVAPLSQKLRENHVHGEEEDDDVLSKCSSQFSSASSHILNHMVNERTKIGTTSTSTTKQDNDSKKKIKKTKKREENTVSPPPRPATAKSSSFTSTTSHTSASTADTTACSSSTTFSTTSTTPTRDDVEFEEEEMSLSLPSPPTSPKSKNNVKKKVVKFCKIVRAKNHLHSDDYTKQERQASWYTSNEITAIRKQTREIVYFYDHNQNIYGNDNDTCTTTTTATSTAVSTSQADHLDIDDMHDIRGLECRTRSGNAKRIKNHVAAMRCVLDEQDRQRCMDDYDPDYLSLLYRDKISLLCTFEAVQIGKQDEKLALEAATAGTTVAALL